MICCSGLRDTSIQEIRRCPFTGDKHAKDLWRLASER
jgi:hypothetical protein